MKWEVLRRSGKQPDNQSLKNQAMIKAAGNQCAVCLEAIGKSITQGGR